MNKLITTLFFVFVISITYGQKEIEKLNNDTYKMVEVIQTGKQIGYFKKTENGDLIRHGKWSLVQNGKVISSVMYLDDKMVWIETKDGIRYTKEQLKIEELKRRIYKLEKELASN